MDYPSNSDKSKLGEYEDKGIERVTSSDAIRRKKGLGKRFKHIFLGGDAKGAMQYAFYAVLIPAAKEAIVDAGREGLEKLVMGDARRSRGPSRPSGPTGYVSYNRFSMNNSPAAEPTRSFTRRARATHDFDEIVLQTRQEAEDVIDRLYDVVARYGAATVSDLYELVGITSTHTDQKWGWEELRGASVSRVRSGYLLDLPEPEPLTS